MRVCHIFGAGERFCPIPPPGPDDLIVAADGGYAWLAELGLRPHLLVGDFDSLAVPPQGVETIRLPEEKDDTDMAAALGEGWARGFRRFHIHGGTGGRLDHTLANLQLLAGLAQRGGRGLLFDRDAILTALVGGAMTFPPGSGGTVSVFAHSDTASGVWEEGFHYPLTDATLRSTVPLGVSNRLTGAPARLSVASGTLLVVYPRECAPEFFEST